MDWSGIVVLSDIHIQATKYLSDVGTLAQIVTEGGQPSHHLRGH
jgi:hypothetical protein